MAEPKKPEPPKSPDVLQPAIHGNVRGVTRIGRKAIAAGALVIGGLLALILFGAQRSPTQKVADNTIPVQSSAPQALDTGHFGANVPIELPTPIATPTQPPVLASPSPPGGGSTPPPAVEATPPSAATAAPPAAPVAPEQSAAQAEAARNAQERRLAADTAREARLQTIAQAFHAPIMMAGAGGAASTAAPGGAGPLAGTINAAGGVAGTTAALTSGGAAGGSGGPSAASAPGLAAGAGSGGGTGGATAGKDPTAFLNGPVGQLANGAAERPVSGDRIPPQTPYEIVAGSVIPATLITAINTQNPGLLTAQVREDVYDSLTGKFLLIPRGSKLIGVYKNDVATGQSRVLVAWKRLIFPDTAAIDLVNLSGADVEGNAGFEGRVDTHFGTLLSQTLLASIITAGLQLSQPQQSTAVTAGSATTVVPPGAVAAGSIGQSVAQALTAQIQGQAVIPPTIYIPRGYPFVVIVDRDLVLTEPYNGAP